MDSLADLSQAMIHAYRVHLEAESEPPNVWKYLEPIKFLELYSSFLSVPMDFKPYGGALEARLVGWNPTRGENSTPVIEDEVLTPVLTAAVRYVESYAADVEQMLGEFLTFRPLDSDRKSRKVDRNAGPFLRWLAVADPESTVGGTRPFDEAVLAAYLSYVDGMDLSASTAQAYKATGRRLLRAWQSGDREILCWPEAGQPAQAASLSGFKWQAPVTVCPFLGRAWRPPFGTLVDAGDEYRTETGHVMAACTTIILYLSGMRPGELSMLSRDCLQEERDTEGQAIRWTIIGTPEKKRSKGRVKQVKPRAVEWVVPEIVARAVQLLRRLLEPFREHHGSPRLLMNLDALQPGRTDQNGFAASERTIRTLLDTFQEMVRDRFKGAPWGDLPAEGRVYPMQFRRTLARHIARQPFGIIAGKLQYKHVSTIVFEGYAGSEDAGFRTVVAEEAVMAGIDMLEELEEDAAAGMIFGRGAKNLLEKVAATKEVARSKALVDRSDRQVAEMQALRSVAVNLHVGVLNLCAFDPSNPGKALCLSEKERENARGPQMNLCSPGKCPNSIIGQCHLDRWKQLRDDAVELRRGARTPLQRASLDVQIAEYEAIVGTAAS
ncbi:site-specific integrase [Roseomonas sp. KE2513]|nr:site-specific integrase [Roseomonas sp. KE2513]